MFYFPLYFLLIRNHFLKIQLKNPKITIFSLNAFDDEVLSQSLEWKDNFYDTHTVFRINRLEDYLKQTNFIHTPLPTPRKTVYNFFLVTNGEIYQDKGLDSHIICKNNFFFCPNATIMTIKSMNSDIQGFYCHFNLDIFNYNFYAKEFIEQFPLLNQTSNTIIKIENDSKDFIIQILQRLEKEYKSKNCSVNFVASCIATLLHEVSRFIEIKPKIKESSASRIAERYKLALGKDIQDKQKISYYADLLSVTPEYLNRCVKATFGKTSRELLDEMILSEAKILLKQSSLNISELAFKIGKQNPSDFIRFFKSKTGFTPKEYRKQL